MKFNIKDVKSWSSRHDVKRGDKGYFFDDIQSMKDKKDCTAFTISGILDNRADCFCIKNRIGISSFNFFLPVEEVKEDKPKEKRFRPFKTINELEKTLNKVNRSAHQFMCVGNDIFIRDKNQMTHLMITRIDRDVKTNEVINVNGMSPIYLFNNYEIRVGAEWLPFGVEVQDE